MIIYNNLINKLYELKIYKKINKTLKIYQKKNKNGKRTKET